MYTVCSYSKHVVSFPLIFFLVTHAVCYPRGMMDENNEQFVAYFLPSPYTITKREEDERDGISFRPDEELSDFRASSVCVWLYPIGPT